MDTLNVSLPGTLRNFVKERVKTGGYGTVSEYIRHLIRQDAGRQAQHVIERELLEGLRSGPAEEMTERDWDTLSRRASGKQLRRKRA